MSVKARIVSMTRSIKERPLVFLRRVLYVVLGPWLAYLLIVNIALQTRVLRGYLQLPPTEVTLEYTRAYSVFPGRFHVEGLVIRGQDSQIEWRLQVDKADYWQSFPNLARKIYHVKHVRADGVEFRARLRIDRTQPAAEEHYAALPPVEGFSDPPLKDPPPAVAEPMDLSKIWKVQLDDVDALHVREVWVDTMRATGDMHVHGRWKFVPTQFIELGPTATDMLGVVASYGATPLAKDVNGNVNVTLGPMNLPNVEARDFLHHLTGVVNIEGNAQTFAILKLFALPKDTTGSGSAPMTLALRLDHGKLVDGTHVELLKAPLEVTEGPMSFKGEPHILVDVRKNGEGIDTGQARVEATALTLAYGGTRFKTARATVSMTSQELDFCAQPLSRSSLDIGVKEAVLSHDALQARVGSVTIKSPLLALDFGAITAAGNLDISAGGIHAPLGKETLSGSLSAKVRTRAEKGETVFSGSSIAFDGSMTPKAESWWTRIEVSSGSVKASLPHHLRMQVQVRAKNATPATALLASVTGVPRWLLEAAPFDDLRGGAAVTIRPDIAELRSVSVKGGAQALRFEYAERGKTTEWLLMADAGPLRVGIHSSRIGTDIRLLDVESWFQKIATNMHTTSPVR